MIARGGPFASRRADTGARTLAQPRRTVRCCAGSRARNLADDGTRCSNETLNYFQAWLPINLALPIVIVERDILNSHAGEGLGCGAGQEHENDHRARMGR